MAELWALALDSPEVDPAALADAVEQAVTQDAHDFRTALLIRDSTDALEHYWGKERLLRWLAASPVGRRIEAIREQDLGAPGFSSLRERLVESTNPDTVRQFLRDLGSQVTTPLTLRIGGSIALILTGYLARRTQDIDIVDEVPKELREQQDLLAELRRRYGLLLTHFQSHYLPAGWEGRLHSLGSYGRLHVDTVDVYDLFLGKLYSRRTKDLDDLRVLARSLDREVLVRRLPTTVALAADPSLCEAAERNWYIVYGEALPALNPGE